MDRSIEIAEASLRDAETDYVGLWQIVTRLRRVLGPVDDDEVKRQTLEVVLLIMKQGLCPGDHLCSGFKYWAEKSAAQVVERIAFEWEANGKSPDLAESICWFSRREKM
jgi:hypothetical protein